MSFDRSPEALREANTALARPDTRSKVRWRGLTVFDSLQLEGPLARFTLRSWTAAANEPASERIHCHDVHQTLELLRRLVDSRSLGRVASFMVALGVQPRAREPLELLRIVARRIVSGELVLTRESIEPMPSHAAEVELVKPPPFELVDNEIDEGVGLAALSHATQSAERQTLEQQARQAAVLRVAAVRGAPFCEICECGS